VPGERTSPTQPFPTRPAPYDRQFPVPLLDLTPALKAEAEAIARSYKMGPMYQPPVLARDGLVGEIHPYSGNWQGGGVDPETGILYVGSITEYQLTGLQKPDPKLSNMNFDAGSYRYMHRRGGGEGAPTTPTSPTDCGAPGPQGLPLFQPPWGRITAIDLNTGAHLWMVPNGDTPDCVKNHPALKGVTIPPTGRLERAGLLVTKTLLIAGEGGGLRNPSGPLAGGPMLHAYDKQNGQLLSSFRLPGRQTGVPMTYLANGRQYIIVAVGNVGQSGELVALGVR
jgi:quinoprotein glucose dehydrogenase